MGTLSGAVLLTGIRKSLHVVLTGWAESIDNYGELIAINDAMLDIARDGEGIALLAEAGFVTDSQRQFTLDNDSCLLMGMAVSEQGAVGLKRGIGEHDAFSPDQPESYPRHQLSFLEVSGIFEKH